MEKIDQPCIPSKVVETIEDAVDFAKTIGYPVIVRPAFTLGGTGGGIADNEEMLRDITKNGLRLSPITQVLIEKCISGWKEIEFEVIRDRKGNVITVCSMENFDPVGVHTGDSIVIAPTVTLTDREYQMLRTAAINIISELKVEGGCNCQFALHPDQHGVCSYRGKPSCVPFFRTGIQGNRLPDCKGGCKNRHRLYTGRDRKRRLPERPMPALNRRWTMWLSSSRSGRLISSSMQSVHWVHR